MTPYEELMKNIDSYLDRNENDINAVNKSEIPQHILMAKNAYKMFKDYDAGFTVIKGKFYFTEAMVNKLMYFAYLLGSKDINQKSYDKGYNDSRANIAEYLGFREE